MPRILVVGLLLFFSAPAALAPQVRADAFDFAGRVAPIFELHCLRCHSGSSPQGELSLASREQLLIGGSSGPALVAGKPDESLLLQYVSGADPQMPKEDEPLDEADVASIRAWITAGAPWPSSIKLEIKDNWWSRRPVVRPEIPSVPADQLPLIRSPIDAFVIAKLHKQGMQLSPEVDPRTFVRRLYYDLLGLPPTPEQIADFDARVVQWREQHPNESSDELPQPLVAQLVDDLLASPHYGERWARHWLDVVKYADTCGYDKDKLRPHAWPYRDYVIRAFNEDKPYTRFVEEQIAGDVLFPGDPDGILGLGFIAAGPWDFIGHAEVPETKIDGKIARNLDRDDMVTNTINTFCSTTIQCARCHDHKFDPYTQEHYYGLQSVFAAVDRANRSYDIDPRTTQRRSELAAEIASLSGTLKAIEEEGKAAVDATTPGAARQSPSDAQERQDQRAALEAELARAQQQLAELPESLQVYAAATQFDPEGSFHPTGGVPRNVNLLHRGNVLDPGKAALPGALPLSYRPEPTFALPENHDESARRAALARWIVDRDHPLTWRSIVNRVWLYHFGQGIVGSPNDFGRMGQRPTHPELLDWLAVEFRDGGQSMKHLHRLIAASRTYRQSSAHNDQFAAIDSNNRYLWRMNRRRLEAEEIRDAILAASGRLDPSLGGPGFYLFSLEKTDHSPHYEYHKFDANDPASHRRTIYRFVVRSQPDPFMTTLDCADSSQSTPQRDETLNALQSLSMLNSQFNLAMAQHFAKRVEVERSEVADQVIRAFELAVGRRPNHDEQTQLHAFARSHGLANLCRALFNLSEFVYLD